MSHTHYGTIVADAYDAGEARHAILHFYQREWERVGRPQPILEPMCGTGFFFIPFLEAGADIEGLDASPAMLEHCRAKCAVQALQPRLYQQRLEGMDLPRQYAFIFIPDRSFGQISELASAQTCLHQFAHALCPGGWLILDLKTPAKPGEFGIPGQTSFSVEDRPDGSTVVSTSIWGERDAGRVIRNWNKYERYREGQLIDVEVFDYQERLYEREEFSAMLRTAGFTNIEAVRAYDGTEPREHDTVVYRAQQP